MDIALAISAMPIIGHAISSSVADAPRIFDAVEAKYDADCREAAQQGHADVECRSAPSLRRLVIASGIRGDADGDARSSPRRATLRSWCRRHASDKRD